MSPMLKNVEKAGIKGLKLKRKPHRLLPEDFFTDVNKLKNLFAKLINTNEKPKVKKTVLITTELFFFSTSFSKEVPEI